MTEEAHIGTRTLARLLNCGTRNDVSGCVDIGCTVHQLFFVTEPEIRWVSTLARVTTTCPPGVNHSSVLVSLHVRCSG